MLLYTALCDVMQTNLFMQYHYIKIISFMQQHFQLPDPSHWSKLLQIAMYDVRQTLCAIQI